MDRVHTSCQIARKLLAPFPTAKAHLQHYLQGTGETIAIHLSDVWENDAGLQSLFSFTVRPMIQRGAESGSLIVPQTHLRNWNWRLALGSMTYNWSLNDQDLTLDSLTTYKWSPDEARITRPLHQALESISLEGASPFKIIGAPFSLSLADLPKLCTLPRPAFHRRLYL